MAHNKHTFEKIKKCRRPKSSLQKGINQLKQTEHNRKFLERYTHVAKPHKIPQDSNVFDTMSKEDEPI